MIRNPRRLLCGALVMLAAIAFNAQSAIANELRHFEGTLEISFENRKFYANQGGVYNPSLTSTQSQLKFSEMMKNLDRNKNNCFFVKIYGFSSRKEDYFGHYEIKIKKIQSYKITDCSKEK